MAHVLIALSNGAVLLLVVTTMLAMGFSLTVAQILAPLSRIRLVVLALAANFVLVPVLAFALGRRTARPSVAEAGPMPASTSATTTPDAPPTGAAPAA